MNALEVRGLVKMACRQYYDGLCMGGDCLNCKYDEIVGGKRIGNSDIAYALIIVGIFRLCIHDDPYGRDTMVTIVDPIALIGWSVSLLSLAGSILNARMNWRGHALWICSNVLGIVYDMLLGLWEQLPMFAGSILITAYGIRAWNLKLKNNTISED
jgi:hypothetical protein